MSLSLATPPSRPRPLPAAEPTGPAAGPGGERAARLLSWTDIVRLGLVQMAIGSVVALTTSTLNRVMVVELALPAMLPGALVGLYYAVQLTRPNWGHRSDMGGARTPWVLGGVAALALGGVAATLGAILIETRFALGLAVSVAGYAVIGAGVGAAGTSLLALLATGTRPDRRAAAGAIVWLMMILGVALTAGGVGAALDPYSHERLLDIVTSVCVIAVALSAAAVWGIERGLAHLPGPAAERTSFRAAMAELWRERRTRAFAVFVFLSMTAYFMQELILEPFAGHVFAYTPGESTAMAGLQNGGVFLGMLTVGLAASGRRLGSLRLWTAGGCLGSAGALAGLAVAGLGASGAGLTPLVVALGYFNGVFAVAAIGAMMQLAGEGRAGREGARMGLWGAAQAMAAGFGGFLGAAAVDAMRLLAATPATAYGAVFLLEAALFLAAAALALRAVTGPALQPAAGG